VEEYNTPQNKLRSSPKIGEGDPNEVRVEEYDVHNPYPPSKNVKKGKKFAFLKTYS
jgi:hypothetical protein